MPIWENMPARMLTRTPLAPDVELLTGETYASNATVFYAPQGALLVDTLASREDARALLRHIEEERRSAVRLVLCTHGFSDHMAGLGLLSGAVVLAHADFLTTFDREASRTEEEAGFRFEPHVALRGSAELRWGAHTLHVRPLPGHTESTLGIDVPSLDAVFLGDTAVGHMAYVRYGRLEDLRGALRWGLGTGRTRVVQGHGGLRGPETLSAALHYLEALEAAARAGGLTEEVPLEAWLPAGTPASDFERYFHQRNLEDLRAGAASRVAAGESPVARPG